MNKNLTDLPDDILVEIFSRYLSRNDLRSLEQVCRQFRTLLDSPYFPWKRVVKHQLMMGFSYLKSGAKCPMISQYQLPKSNIFHPFQLAHDYSSQVIFHDSNGHSNLFPIDLRRPFDKSRFCSEFDCDVHRLMENFRPLSSLTSRWKIQNRHQRCTLVKFVKRAETSLLQYDEHLHQLWFTHGKTLLCLNLQTKAIIHRHEFLDDDILCYKVFDNRFIFAASGQTLCILSRETNHIYSCPTVNTNRIFPNDRADILSLDVFSNNNENYLIVNGSRDYTVNVRTFQSLTRSIEPIWVTHVDDRVLCTRFTTDGNHFLIGTGGRMSFNPLLLFDVTRPQPLHTYNGNYRCGAGVRCIEWVSPNVFIAAGFDAQYKEFDLRTGQCHYTFDDPFGNDIFCLHVSADQQDIANTVVLGSNRYSTVILSNRKTRKTENVFYVASELSPVHSLAVTPEYLFASLDRSIVALNFSDNDLNVNQIFHRL